MMLAMYLAYTACLARYNQHTFNRGVLMIIYAVAFAGTPALMAILGRHTPATYPAVSVTEIQNVVSAGVPVAKPLWGTILIWIYMFGMAAVALKTLSTWLRLIKVIHSGEKIMRDGFVLVLTDDERYAPFSWLHYVVISRSDYTDHCTAILTHELKHIASGHWVDLLIAQGVCIVNWFNPAAWLMRDELMLVHEYQADRVVMDRGLDAREYQMLLIKKAVGARFPSLANSLNHSKLKKRITMMYKEKSGAGPKAKALALVPMLALSLGIVAVPAVSAAVSTISAGSVTVSKGNENSSQNEVSSAGFKIVNINHDGNVTSVTLRGENFGNSISVSDVAIKSKGITYQAASMQCDMADGVATIRAKFNDVPEMKDSQITMTVNGETQSLTLNDVAGSVYIEKDTTSVVPAKIIRSTTGKQQGKIYVYVNGKEVAETELNKIPQDSIQSVSIINSDIMVTVKK